MTCLNVVTSLVKSVTFLAKSVTSSASLEDVTNLEPDKLSISVKFVVQSLHTDKYMADELP